MHAVWISPKSSLAGELLDDVAVKAPSGRKYRQVSGALRSTAHGGQRLLCANDIGQAWAERGKPYDESHLEERVCERKKLFSVTSLRTTVWTPATVPRLAHQPTASAQAASVSVPIRLVREWPLSPHCSPTDTWGHCSSRLRFVRAAALTLDSDASSL